MIRFMCREEKSWGC